MPRKETFVDFTEIIRHAVMLGYKQHRACDILDRFRPQYEIRSRTVNVDQLTDPEEIEEYGYTDEEIKIMLSFLASIKKNEVTILDE
jgi:hypothetical protein